MHKAKKSLGQNFLKGEFALRKIVEAGEIKKGDVILEIGPGKGALTEKLLQAEVKVLAVEKDRELFEFLKKKFEKEIKGKKLILIHDDILKFNLSKTLLSFSNNDVAKQDILRKTLKPLYYKIIANIPYNITGAILKKFLTTDNQPKRMILMVQHEVAKRIVGKGSNPSTPLRVKESILSISVKAYGEPRMVTKVDKRYFSPSPKVDSAIIAIKNISRKTFKENDINEERFWGIVKAGFAHKRKKLSSNLKKEGIYSLETLENKRAEDLTLVEWIILAKN